MLVGTILGAAGASSAADPSSFTERWRSVDLTNQNGLRSNRILDGCEAQDGTAWASTAPGLMSFAIPVPFFRQPMVIVPIVAGGAVICSLIGWMAIRRRRHYTQLRESEALFQQLAGSIQGVFWLVDVLAKRILYVGPAYERVFGRSPDRLYDNSNVWDEAILDEDRGAVTRCCDVPQQGLPIVVEYRIALPNGSVRWICDRGFPIRDERGEVSRYAGIAEDITQRKLAEAALLKKEAHQTLVLNSLPMALYTALPAVHSPATWVSDHIDRISGFPAENFLEVPNFWRSRLHPDDKERVFAELETLHSLGTLRIEYRWQCADGSYRWFLDQPTLVHDDMGNASEIIGTWLDITEQKLAEDALQTSDAELRAIVNTGVDGIITIDEAGVIRSINPATEKLFGYSREEMIGQNVKMLMPSPDKERHDEYLNQYRMTGKKRIIGTDREVQGRRKDGSTLPLHLAVGEIRVGERRMFVGQLHDLTRRTTAEQALQRAHDELEARVVERTAELTKANYTLRAEIVERARAEAAFRESEARFRQVAENIHEVFWLTDWKERKLLYASPAYEKVFRKSLSSIYKDRHSWKDDIHPEDRDRVVDSFARGAELGRYVEEEYRLLHPDGTTRWIRDRAFPILDESGEVSRIVGVAEDITPRKKIEEVLLVRQKQQEVVAALGVQALTCKDVHAFMNDVCKCVAQTLDLEYCKVLEYRPEEQDFLLRAGVGWQEGLVGRASVAGRSDSQAGYTMGSNSPVVVDDLQTEQRFSGPALLLDHGVNSGISVVIHGPDRPFGVFGAHTRARRSFTTDDVHFLQALANLLSDVIDTWRTEAALRESRARLAEAQRIARLGHWDHDVQTGELAWSDEIYRIFGFESQEFGATYDAFLDAVHPDDRQAVREAVEQALYHRAPYSIEHRVLRPDGTEVIVHERAEVTYDEHGRPTRMLGTVQDITERRHGEQERAKLKELLHQSQKMKAIGELAAGIAHDFNNLLMVMLGRCEQAKDMLPDQSPVLEPLAEAEKAALKARELTDSLLTFSRHMPAKKEPLNLCETVQQSCEMIRRMLPTGISLELNTCTPPIWMTADSTRVHQLILNLAINARDAMPDGGKLSIRVSSASESDMGTLKSELQSTGALARLTVRDTGHGMSPEVVSRALEPFYTTKPRGRGTGLGLSIVHGIVEEHGGSLHIHSEVGKGSVFTVLLPCSKQEVLLPILEAASSPIASGRGRAVLLISRNAQERALISSMLQAHEYTVVKAESLERGIARLETSKQHVDLIIISEDGTPTHSLDRLNTVCDNCSMAGVIVIVDDAEDKPAKPFAESAMLLRRPFLMSDLARLASFALQGKPRTAEDAK